ncbi:transketolase [Spiroplasma endosymbiont of Amphibalanus improvisus]|uniref:transketolase n=1 Tax=Spiroplasma endosymbiont of Amphibalanus improvisus TaxID=3066327 RepID=UPI00313D4119
MASVTNKSINTIRMLGTEMVNKANSGHPGIVLGAAPMLYTLFTKHLRVNPKIDKWINRDRFILSAGHGSALLYSMLHLSGFEISINDLQQFRQLGSITPGHPESHLTPGVDVTTGPLGQGFAMAVGQALAEVKLANQFNSKDIALFDHYTYALCGDGDLQEGVTQESLSLAGHWKLNKLIVLFDSNDVQLDNMVNVAQSENIKQRFEAANWEHILVKDGNDIDEINKAIEKAKASNKPSLIEVKTQIGYGATKAGTPAVHGAPIGEDIVNLRKALNWKEPEFYVPSEVYSDFKLNVKVRGTKEYEKWFLKYTKYLTTNSEEGKILKKALQGDFAIKPQILQDLKPDKPEATRVSSGKIIQKLNIELPNLIGGSADLTGSTKAIGGDGDFQYNSLTGRNLAYGVREFAMTAINNGIYQHRGLLPFASGFLVFADYSKPALRLSAIMRIPTLYIFTHDSVAVGEDGPTHQPIEQLSMLRSIPNFNVYRPADFNETAGAYVSALQKKHTPSAIILTRQDLEQLENSSIDNVNKGAYKIYGDDSAEVILTATGSEVSLAIEVAKELNNKKISTKVISMPCREMFECQEEKYINDLYNKTKLKVTIELGSTFGWSKYGDVNIGIDSFGESAPFKDVMKHFNFNKKSIIDIIIKKL